MTAVDLIEWADAERARRGLDSIDDLIAALAQETKP